MGRATNSGRQRASDRSSPSWFLEEGSHPEQQSGSDYASAPGRLPRTTRRLDVHPWENSFPLPCTEVRARLRSSDNIQRPSATTQKRPGRHTRNKKVHVIIIITRGTRRRRRREPLEGLTSVLRERVRGGRDSVGDRRSVGLSLPIEEGEGE